VFDGATILIGGFSGYGVPHSLIQELSKTGVKDLVCIFSAGDASDSSEAVFDVSRLVSAGQVRKLISPLPFYPGAGGVLEERWMAGELEIEVVPQGVLAERLRAGGAGLGGLFLPTGLGTRFAEGKEVRTLAGQDCLLEVPLTADFALLRADTADTLGNTTYSGVGRNWGPVMAMSASVTIVEVDEICEPGEINPELVITPGIFVNRIVRTAG
jgi:3-oxoacid CoA-transferase A subunit